MRDGFMRGATARGWRLAGAALGALALVGLNGAAEAGKPQDASGNFLGNGFPSGPHFNLNLNAKWDHFSCPGPEFLVTADNNSDGDLGQIVDSCDVGDSCDQVFGNVIFLPREQGTDPISIVMESGRKGPKSNPTATDLEVIDWCTESFPDDGSSAPPLGDPAVLRLPKNDEGYAVYARVAGKPGDNELQRTFQTIPELHLVQDEAGNDLLMLLGWLTGDGVFNSDGILLKRTDDSRKGKGVRKATNMTPLFEWTGEICYLQDDTDPYCLDEAGDNLCTTLDLCCVDSIPDNESPFDRCDKLADVGELDLDGNLVCPATDGDGVLYVAITADCRQFDNEWVFNIADFVDVLWKITSDAYHVQIRFYPLPLQP